MEIAVKIGELRNGLSAYLRKIRHGAEVAIFDRDKPVGRLVPYDKKLAKPGWQMIPAPAGNSGLASLSYPPLKRPVHGVQALLEERRKR